MILQKCRLLIVFAFLSIFGAKMVISGAPVFFKQLDKELMRSVIMQLETENNGEETSKFSVKMMEYKSIVHPYEISYAPEQTRLGVENDFIEHYGRYVNPYHPSVPTPPPNFS